jgi:AbrB family looped-hinge helix DNA binding protein
MPKTTISSKYQITLPARLVREIGLKPGDQVAVELDGLRIVLHPRPKDWVSYTAGSLKGVYGETKEDVDAYLREVRGSWGTYLDDEEEDDPSESS